MSNRGPFSHPDIELARQLLAELRSFAFPDLENDYHAQRAACAAIDKIRRDIKSVKHFEKPLVPDENGVIDWN